MIKKRTQSQIGKMSRRKGKSFECWCARYFTLWTGLKWESTRNSGRTDLKGDIYCVSRPDLRLVVECKNRKEYSVHAMLKPTKAFTDMVTVTVAKVDHPVLFIVKNDTAVWVSWCSNLGNFEKCPDVKVSSTAICVSVFGMEWYKIEHIEFAEIDGVKFDGAKLAEIGKESKEE